MLKLVIGPEMNCLYISCTIIRYILNESLLIRKAFQCRRIDLTFYIPYELETRSVPKRLKKKMIDTATNLVKNLLKDIGDLSLLPTE